MAGIFKRKDMWCACWKQGNTTIRRSTGVRVKENGMSAKAAEALARQTAELMAQAANGGTACHRAMQSIRAAAVAFGEAASMPTVREYLESFPELVTQKSDAGRKRAFRLFADFVGGAALRLDMVTAEHCRDFIRYSLKEVSKGTTELRKAYLSHAFKKAVVESNLLDRNPWQAVSVPKEAQALNPGAGADKQKRLPFTLTEIRKLIDQAPAPWCDIVAVSYFGYGLRLSDVCLLRWDSINWAKGYIQLTEKKTKKERCIPLQPELAARLIKLRTQTTEDGYIFPVMAHYYNSGKASYASTQFTAILRSMGIIQPETTERPKGKRHNISPKSFHSIRHTVVSCLRGDATLSADIVRDAVGHDSEEVERGYFTATLEQRAQVGNKLSAALNTVNIETYTA